MVQSLTVMATHIVDTLNFKARPLHLSADPSQGTGSIGSRKDVLPHEKSPSEVFKTPSTTESRNLKVEHSIIFHHTVNHGKEFLVATNSNVLRHFKTRDSIIAFFGKIISFLELHRILEKDFCAVLGIKLSTIGQLFFGKGDTSDISSVLLGETIRQIGPATSNVQDGHSRLKFDSIRDIINLVILGLLESLSAFRIQSRGVHHCFTQSCLEPIITLVVTFINITFIVIIGVENGMPKEITHQVARFIQAEGRSILITFQDIMQVIIASLNVVFQLGSEGGVLEYFVASNVGIFPGSQYNRGNNGQDERGKD
mmetsp:Transcript_38435/g.69271  ORF Transcript_38435/g.69271 Transcript_38435/m.69271 type:complete len:312 (+) Transcript_38435:525-1460(+)